MELLTSEKFKLPVIYFITDREEIKKVSTGFPFICGNEKDKPYIVRLLEYEILYNKAKESGMPFDFKQILIDEGYDLAYYEWCETAYFDYKTGENNQDEDILDTTESIEESLNFDSNGNLLQQYINDGVAIVDLDKVKGLNVFPTWKTDLEEAILTNIHNFISFNPNMYNKKLDIMSGGIEFTTPDKNLVGLDISVSIPKAVGVFQLTMAKNWAEEYYADILITGRKTVLIPREEIYTLDIETAYEKWGNGQEQKMFKKLVTSEERHYKTAIVFGDDNHPGSTWDRGDSYISDEDGKKLCKWKIDNLISFHTQGVENIAGYARWFDVPEENIKRIDNWVKYLVD